MAKRNTTVKLVSGAYAKRSGLGRFVITSSSIGLRRKRDESLLEPYDWGTAGRPKGQPMSYVPGKGWIIGKK